MCLYEGRGLKKTIYYRDWTQIQYGSSFLILCLLALEMFLYLVFNYFIIPPLFSFVK